MRIYLYSLVLLIISSYITQESYASFNEWYFGIQGGFSSLTGKHHYANAGDGDKKEDKKEKSNENNNNNNNNNDKDLNERYKRLLETHQKLMNEFHNQNPPVGPVNAQGMRSEPHVPVGMVNDMPRKIEPEAVANGAPPPPPPPPLPQSAGNNYYLSPFSRAIRDHPLVQRNMNSKQFVGNSQPQPVPDPIQPPTPNYSNGGGESHRYGDIKLNERSKILGFHIGFFKHFNNYKNYVIGSEFYCHFNNEATTKELKVDNRASEGKVSIRQPYTIGIAGTAGYYIHPRALFYGRLGIEINKFVNEYYDLRFVGASYPYNQSPMKERYNFSLRGIVPGVGIKFSTMRNVDVSLEYTYSMMQKIHLRSDDVTINSVNRGYLFQPNQHRFMLKLSYFIK